MGLFRKKNMWQRAIKPVADQVDPKTLAKSGVVTVVSAVGLTVVNAAVSAARRKDTGR